MGGKLKWVPKKVNKFRDEKPKKLRSGIIEVVFIELFMEVVSSAL